MQETPKQYTKRILAYVTGKKPLRVQQSTVKQIERLIHPLTPQQLRRRPAPGKWSIAEILAHLADTELVGGYRIRMILGSIRTSGRGTPTTPGRARGNPCGRFARSASTTSPC